MVLILSTVTANIINEGRKKKFLPALRGAMFPTSNCLMFRALASCGPLYSARAVQLASPTPNTLASCRHAVPPSHWTRPGLRPPIGASPGSTGRLCRRKTNLTLARDNTRLLYSHVFGNVLAIVFVFVFVFVIVFNTKQT